MSADHDNDRIAELLREEAGAFAYPPTPDIAARLSGRREPPPARRPLLRRLAPLALVAALILAATLAVPDVRAAALRLLQIGAVRVRVEPAPPPTALPAAGTIAPAQSAAPAPAPPASPALGPGLSGATTLAEAVRRVDFPVRLPTFPEGLGPPDRVFLQNLDGDALILVWLDPASLDTPLLSLHALTSEAFALKTVFGDETERLAEPEVGGRPALWVRGPHLLQVGRDGGADLAPVRLVEGNTLIWTVGELTYRLECDLPLEEALRVAESLR
jgi:hypothetical protein